MQQKLYTIKPEAFSTTIENLALSIKYQTSMCFAYTILTEALWPKGV
ncbi:hypothetical protein M7I_0467 [Glarea lozoyensis 74030]|uniref:Uncharacterized protein n=1 Tax=Glarea lozoyensis (strain ATCC 74030 / MF5533) TaxID=1104152 RepID=H0EDL2_GLAL7|nr:hypothetical protein M7I_0467 [Glarea lozoyensis 74030]